MTWKARPSVLWHCWLGHLTRKIVSEVTYNVSSGTLNPTIPCGLCRKFARGYTLSAALSRNEEPLRRARVDVRHGTRLHGQGGDDAAILDAAHLVAIIADYVVDITNWWGDKATLHLSCRAAAEAAGDEGRTAHVGYLYLSGILSMKTTNDPTKPRHVCAAYICKAVHNLTTAGEGGRGGDWATCDHFAPILIYPLIAFHIAPSRRSASYCSCWRVFCFFLIVTSIFVGPSQPFDGHRATDYYTTIRWLVHWPLMCELLHLVQRGGAWAGCGPAQPPSLYQM